MAPESLPNLLRAAALVAWTTHGRTCPDHATHKRAVALLTRVADAVETGAPLRAGERAAALRTAHGYLTTNERAEIPA